MHSLLYSSRPINVIYHKVNSTPLKSVVPVVLMGVPISLSQKLELELRVQLLFLVVFAAHINK